jgi:hypothetical protein
MNERIQQLAEQADDYERKLGKGIGPTRDEKFAELIVKECARIAETAEPYQSSDLIKKHFGVDA